jgi:hypothetical protein
VAGDVGVNFADRLTRDERTNGLEGLQAPDFDLKNSISYGGKIGYFLGIVGSGSRAKSCIPLRTSKVWITIPASISV